MDWTEKYRPRSLKEVVGNGPNLQRLVAWAESWSKGIPAKRAVVLAGSPGTGKTSTALALANDMGWQVVELNASDARNAETIQKVAQAGAVHQTFASDGSFHSTTTDGRRKLIVLDEADNLYERAGSDSGPDGSSLSDRGGKAAIIATIRQTHQPIILIVNDLYALEKGSGSPLRSLTETLKFTRVQARSIAAHLARIASEEQITTSRDVLDAISVRAAGDLRSAVRDLESLAMGRKEVTMASLASLGARDTETSMFDLLRHILKGRRLSELQKEVWAVDGTPEDLVLWVDENMAKEYKDPRDLVAGYEMLSRADIFLRRTKKTQDYGLWAYASDLATLGVSAVRTKEYREFTPFGFPQWLSKMSRSRGLRQTKDALASHLAAATHTSRRKARMEQVEPFAAIFQADLEFAAAQSVALELADEEVAILLGDDATAKRIKEIRAAQEVPAEPKPRKKKRGELELDEEDESDDDAVDSGASDGDDSTPRAAARRATNGPDDQDDEGDARAPKPAKPTPAAGQKRLF